MRDLRLVVVAGAAWLGALACISIPGVATPVMLTAFGLSAVVLVIRRRGELLVRRVLRLSGGLVVAALLSTGAVAFSVWSSEPVRDDAQEYAGRVSEVSARVSTSPRSGADGRLWMDAETIAIGAVGAPAPWTAPIRIGMPDPGAGEQIGVGTVVRVIGQARGGEHSERAVLIVFADRVIETAPPQGMLELVAGELRRQFADRAARLPAPGSMLLPGLAVGDTRAVDERLDAAMITSGLSHLLAVSGSNVSLITGAAFALVAGAGGGRALRVIVAVLALCFFVILVTPEPSVMRAAAMSGAGMLALLLGRPRAGAGVLLLAVLILLVSDPWLALTAGFALSVAATAALILLAPGISRGLSRLMPRPLALGIAVPLAAQLACGPIVAMFAEEQSVLGVPANLLAAPAAPIATVFGVLACALVPIPVLADFAAACAWLPAAWIAATAELIAASPIAAVLVEPGPVTALLVAMVSMAVGALLFRRRGKAADGIGLRRAAVFVLVVALAGGSARALTEGPLAVLMLPQRWSIAACDVGQGDAFVLRSRESIALIDTGPDPALLRRCLDRLGIDSVDLLVLTHFDLDHVGGVEAVAGRAGLVVHGPTGEPQDERLLRELREQGSTVTEVAAGQEGSLGALRWRVLWPLAGERRFPPGNDASVVLAAEGEGSPRALFLGDLGAQAQRSLLSRSTPGGGWDVISVAHHGSADQDPELYDMLRARLALVSAGEGNPHGHPRAETLSVLEAVGTAVARTDQEGMILVTLTDGEGEIWREKGVTSPETPDTSETPGTLDTAETSAGVRGAD